MRKLINKNQTQECRTYLDQNGNMINVHRDGVCISDDKEMDSVIDYLIKEYGFEYVDAKDKEVKVKPAVKAVKA